jgi:hypothetical protein
MLESPNTLSQEDFQPFYDYIKPCGAKLEGRVEEIFKTLEMDLRLDEKTSPRSCVLQALTIMQGDHLESARNR